MVNEPEVAHAGSRRLRLGRRRLPARVRWTAIALAIAGVICLGPAVWATLTAGSRDPAKDVPVMDAASEHGEFHVTWLGDTLFGDAAKPLLARHGADWTAARLPAASPGVVVVNLEGPITRRTEPWDPAQRWTYDSDPTVAETLARLGVDVATLANNHAMDRGPLGLADTISSLRAAGILAVGAGDNSRTAGLPLLIRTDVGTLAIVNLADEQSRTMVAGTTRPGVQRLTVENLSGAIAQARHAGATWVVAAVHWGENYRPVDERQRRWAGALAQAGYDLVVGTGPHYVQPIEIVGHTPVVYSLGNFVMGTPGRFADYKVPGYGLVLTTAFTSDHTLALSIRCIVTDNAIVGFQPLPCTEAESRAVMTPLNQQIVLEGDVGRLTVLPTHASNEP